MSEIKEESFEELLQQSLKEVTLEKTVTGTIIAITRKDEIVVDLGYKADGIIPKSEYSYEEDADPRKEFKIGDKITADVLKMNDGLGNVLLSYKKAKARKARAGLEEKIENKEPFESIVTQVLEQGVVTSYQGIRIFIPMSLSGITREEKPEEHKGKKITFEIIEYEEKGNRVIGSVKAIKDKERKKQLDVFWEDAQIGKEYEGRVNSLSSYGAFIDLGPVQGLLHISEMAWSKNVLPNELFQVGQVIRVKAIEVDKENRRIKLTYEDKGPDPWDNIENIYHINDVVEVKVVKLMPFGAFVELESGMEGLVHVSQIAEKRVTKPEEELQVGQKVNSKIIDIDAEKRKIELSIRELEGTSREYKEELEEKNKEENEEVEND